LTFQHVVKDKHSGQVIVEGSARLAATDANGKVKRLDKPTVAALHS
jgi:acyl-CoA thioester hydrolase